MAKTTKSSKRRTQTRKLAPKRKQLGQKEMKDVKGGIIAVLIGAKDNIQDGTSNITDGTSNTIIKK